MQPTISVVTLVTDNLERAVRFYRDGLGLPTKGIVGNPEDDTQVAFFNLNQRFKLALWPRSSLARQLGTTVQGSGHMLSHNVTTQAAVDELVLAVENAGGNVLKRPHRQPWGCYGAYFSDPDGHCWELTYNPKYAG